MAQLKEDEWPADGEPTTAEQEGDVAKREGSHPPRSKTGQSKDSVNGAPDEFVIDNVDPALPT